MKSIVVLISVLSLFGCASKPGYEPSRPVKQNESVLYGQGGGLKGLLKESVGVLGTTKDIELARVDGKKVAPVDGAKYREYRVPSGTHRLEIECRIRKDGSDSVDGKKEISFDLKGGKEYVLDAEITINPESGLFKSTHVCMPTVTLLSSK